jgi:sec-independent protein translocase protein TatB
MFDIGWGEFLVIGIVALIVIGPKELPGVLRTIGQGVAKVRRMAGEFQSQFNEAMREAEMAEIKKSVEEMNAAARGFQHYDPLNPDGLEPKPETKVAEKEALPQPETPPRPEAATAAPSLPEPETTPSEPEATPTEPEPVSAADTPKDAPADTPKSGEGRAK